MLLPLSHRPKPSSQHLIRVSLSSAVCGVVLSVLATHLPRQAQISISHTPSSHVKSRACSFIVLGICSYIVVHRIDKDLEPFKSIQASEAGDTSQRHRSCMSISMWYHSIHLSDTGTQTLVRTREHRLLQKSKPHLVRLSLWCCRPFLIILLSDIPDGTATATDAIIQDESIHSRCKRLSSFLGRLAESRLSITTSCEFISFRCRL